MLIVSNADPTHYPELANANINSSQAIAFNIMDFDCDFGGLLASCWPTLVLERIVREGRIHFAC